MSHGVCTELCPFFWDCLQATANESKDNHIFREICLGLIPPDTLATRRQQCNTFANKSRLTIKKCLFYKECTLRRNVAILSPKKYNKKCLGLVNSPRKYTSPSCFTCFKYNMYLKRELSFLRKSVPEFK